jgi:hypothetical protein
MRHVPDLPGPRFALVVATATYDDPGLANLRAPAQDARDMIDILSDPGLGGFTVTALLDEPEHQIRHKIHDFLDQRDPNDLALVYLSCHGVLSSRDQLHFATINTAKNRLGSTAIAANWLHERLEECRARQQVLILDCCFSGAFADAKAAADLGLERRLIGAGRGRDLLTASRGSEYSYEGRPLPGADITRSKFTAALVDGIRSGDADANHDGYITVEEAFHHAADALRASGAQQSPQYTRTHGEGKIVLSLNPNRNLAAIRSPAFATAAAPGPDPGVQPPHRTPPASLHRTPPRLRRVPPSYGSTPGPSPSAGSLLRLVITVIAVVGLTVVGKSLGPAILSFAERQIAQVSAAGRGSPSPSPVAPEQIVAQARGKGPWTVRGHGYEFSVTKITHTTGPFGPNEGKPCLRVVAAVERFAADDHTSMRLVVIDNKRRILGADQFSGKGSLEPPLHQRTQFETVLVIEGNGASTLTFTIRGAFWPDGQDLILKGVPVPG